MALIKPTVQRSADDSLIPMINIVFLLLIFFMIAGQIQISLPEDFVLPEGDTGTPAELGHVELHLSAEGYLSIEGKSLTIAQLDEHLLIAKHSHWVLMADKNVTAKQLDSVLRQLQKAGVTNLKLMTQRRGSV